MIGAAVLFELQMTRSCDWFSLFSQSAAENLSPETMNSLPARRGAYGIDAPIAPILLFVIGACMLALSITQLQVAGNRRAKVRATVQGCGGVWMLLNAGLYVYFT